MMEEIRVSGPTTCREALSRILAIQRETRDCLSEVMGPPVQEAADEEGPVGTLACMECSLRAVERYAGLILGMVSGLHDRI